MKIISIMALVSLTLTGCGKQSVGPTVTKEVVGSSSNIIAKDSSGWPMEVNQYDVYNDVRLIKYQMPREQLENERNAYRETDLQPYPVSSSYNTQVFRMHNVDDYKGVLFIPPKIWAYGHTDGGRTAPYANNDGTITIPFPFILVTGLENEVPDPSGLKKITIPDSIKVKNPEGLYSETNKKIVPLPGCPKRVIISFNAKEYDATPSEFLRGDYCDIAKPIHAYLKLPKNEARYFLEKAIYNNAAHVSVIYETKARFNKARVQLSFNRSLIWEEIQTKLKAKYYWAELDVKVHLRDILSKQTMNVSVVGNVNENMERIIRYAIDQFMEPFVPVTPEQVSDCGGGKFVACLKVSYNKFKERNDFSLEWYESDTAMTGQNYVTFANLQPLTDRVVAIGKDESVGPLKKNRKIETGLTIVEGDLVDITPSKILLTMREKPTQTEDTKDNHVCLATAPYEKVCVKWESCSGKHCIQRYRECVQWEERGGQCIRTENQWIKSINYSLSEPHLVTIENPVAKLEMLFTGLNLGFQWINKTNGEKEFLECPLTSFDYVADGSTLSARVENSHVCPVFERAQGRSVMMFMVNRMGTLIKYKEGSYSVNYRDEVVSVPKELEFDPEPAFYGTVGIRGYSIWAEGSGGKKF